MTQQEMFDKVATHLLKQRAKSLTEIGTCAYRGLNGLKCAIGTLIPDDKYHPNLETMSAYHVDVASAAGYGGDLQVSDLATKLQVVHDNYTVENWRQQLHEVGKRYNLNLDVLKETA